MKTIRWWWWWWKTCETYWPMWISLITVAHSLPLPSNVTKTIILHVNARIRGSGRIISQVEMLSVWLKNRLKNFPFCRCECNRRSSLNQYGIYSHTRRHTHTQVGLFISNKSISIEHCLSFATTQCGHAWYMKSKWFNRNKAICEGAFIHYRSEQNSREKKNTRTSMHY